MQIKVTYVKIRVRTGTNKNILFIAFLIAKLNFTFPTVRNACVAMPHTCKQNNFIE